MTTEKTMALTKWTFDDRYPYNHSYGFSSSQVWMWELDHKEGWEQNNWCFWTVVLDKTLECSLDSKEIKSGTPKGNQQPWVFIRRTDTEAESPILRPHDLESWLWERPWCWWKVAAMSCEWHQDSCPPEERNLIWGQLQALIAQSFCVLKIY